MLTRLCTICNAARPVYSSLPFDDETDEWPKARQAAVAEGRSGERALVMLVLFYRRASASQTAS